MRHRRFWLWPLVYVVICGSAVAADVAEDVPAGATIGRISVDRQNVFDLANPRENNRLYRLINRLHIRTRENTIRQQLLFVEGDTFEPRLLEESERILRRNKYLYDASLKASANTDDGVDITVSTRDVWTFTPEISLSRKGGENKTIFGVEESNLLGKGHRLLVTRTDDVDRESTAFEYSDPHLSGSWVSLDLRLADNSDGDSLSLNLTKPFHALDARRAAGLTVFDDDRRTALYSLGNQVAEFRHEQSRYSAFGGWSSGLYRGWVRRWRAGIVSDDNRYSAVPDSTLPALIPGNRKLVYPFVGVEILEDRFEKSANSDQIDRSEDFYLGARFAATLGYSSTGLGADRDATIYSASASRGYGSLKRQALLLTTSINGRDERGRSANTIAAINARYYWRQSDRRLFFASLDASRGHALDIDSRIEIGGDTGLRGYPLRYQTGDSHALISVEQRYFTDWYPFRLFRVGGAVFFDAGRVWGDNPAGGSNIGWLKDVGLGLRFSPTRLGTRKIIHLDIAFPLDGDPTIDDVQILLESKRSF